MNAIRLILLTALALLAFASNSILCRLALKQATVDAASFTAIRLLSGSAILILITFVRGLGSGSTRSQRPSPWLAGLVLFTYAATFSYAYLRLTAGTGALLLFGAVQGTMILGGLRHGERFNFGQVCGLFLALCGLVVLVFPSLAAPSLLGSALMILSGISWGIYSLMGKGADDPIAETGANFLRTLPFAAALSAVSFPAIHLDSAGVFYAVLSGAITSGLGYVIWYSVLPHIYSTTAATIQLSVPVIAALAGIILLGEAPTLRYGVASLAILGGIALVTCRRETLKR